MLNPLEVWDLRPFKGEIVGNCGGPSGSDIIDVQF